VVSVAEFAPDDYLIKPFTPNQLLERLVKVNKKKEVFARAYAFIESERPAAALPECRMIASSHPQYAPDAYRLMVDVLMGMEKYDEAEKMLAAILARKEVPWAHMGLAHIHYARSEPRRAEAILEKVAAAHPEYLGAQDFLAKVKTDLAKPDEALAVLEAAGAISSANVNRLRRTGDLAAVVGDHEKSSKLYAKVLERVRNSSLAKAEDFISLSNAYVQLGRMDEAEKVSLEQRRTMRGTPDAELVSRLMEYQRLCGPGNADKEDKRIAAIEGAIKAYKDLTNPITGALELDFVEACFKAGHDDEALAAAQHLLARTDVPEPILARVRANLSSHEAKKARAPAIVPLDQVLAMLGKLNSNGWDEAMGHACQASVNHWEGKDEDPEMLGTARSRLADVLRKYGINGASLDKIAVA
jgi:tetratricopeptide (TPR) repeat protein